jgi:hypothetical protein
MIDVTNSREEGPFSPERAGGVPAMKVVELCFSGAFDPRAIEDMLFREGGLLAYVGTRNVDEVVGRAQAGDEHAGTVIRAMVHQVSREIAAAAAPLCGQVDAILLTGGMAHSTSLVESISQHVKWISRCASTQERTSWPRWHGARSVSCAVRRRRGRWQQLAGRWSGRMVAESSRTARFETKRLEWNGRVRQARRARMG